MNRKCRLELASLGGMEAKDPSVSRSFLSLYHSSSGRMVIDFMPISHVHGLCLHFLGDPLGGPLEYLIFFVFFVDFLLDN